MDAKHRVNCEICNIKLKYFYGGKNGGNYG